MRRHIAIGLTSAFVVSSVLYAPPAKAEESCDPTTLVCLSVVDGVARVTGPGGLSLSQEIPPVEIEVPGPTVEVPVPGPTVTVPGPTTVIERTVPGPTRTVTETQTVTPAPETVTETVTPQLTTPPAAGTGQESIPSDTIAKTPPVHVNTIELTVSQVIGYSLLWIALGALMTLLGMYAMFRLGRREGEHSLDEFIEELRNLTYIRKR